jgi:hypothetical protein
MARAYSDQSYGKHQTIKLGPLDISLTTNASATTAMAHRFLYPAKVTGGTVTFLAAVANDLSASTSFLLQKSTDAGTGMSTFGVADIAVNLATSTFAAHESIDMTVTETAFSAGDEVLFTIEGTVTEYIGKIEVNLEVLETFVESDS